MKLSIIIPTYNSGRYIYDCLMSLESFEYDKDRYEIIVVDGGSSDKTLEIVNSFTAVKVIHSENISISNSRNLAVSKSLGRYLVFIDSYCVVDKHLLIKAEKSLKSFACYGSFYKAADQEQSLDDDIDNPLGRINLDGKVVTTLAKVGISSRKTYS